MRRACDGIQAKLDLHRHEGAGNFLRSAYDVVPGVYAPQYCEEGPPDRHHQYDDGFNDGGGFAV